MKTSHLLALLLCAAPLYADSTYTIRTNNSQRYTDCTLIYKSSSSTKFVGTNAQGKKVEMVIPTSSIVFMMEHKEKETEDKESEADKKADENPVTEAQTEETPTEEAKAEAPAEETIGELKEEAPIADGNLEQAKNIQQAKDETLRLRQKLESIDAQMATLQKPSRSLQSMSKNAKTRVTKNLATLDALVLEINDLQQKFNQTGSGDFSFDIVTVEDRSKYEKDGTAAYKAMLNDMKQKKRSRKVGGLDKFEIIDDRYQGIPEYHKARASYLKTVRVLEKQWTKLKNAEENKRKNLSGDKRSHMLASDQNEIEKLEAYFEKQGEQLAQVWYNPSKRNLKMLQDCVGKAEDALRRSERTKEDEHAGKVTEMLKEYWSSMDEARQKMISGNLEGADKLLRENKIYREIVQLRPSLLPHEYSTPIKEQHKAMSNEIKQRMRDFRDIKMQLERKTNMLDRSIANAESQIDNVLSTIAKEKDMETPEESAEKAQ